MNPIRALIIAEAANPEWTSVPLVGWSHAMALRAITPVHLVTQVRNAAAVRRAGLKEGDDFTSIDSELVAKPFWKLSSVLRGGAGKGWTTSTAISALSYYYFEHLLWKRFAHRLKSGEFDLVHRITPLSPTVPSLLAGKCRKIGVPFILGPLNGGLPWPKWFHQERMREKEWLAPVRSVYKLLPGSSATYRHCSAVIVGSKSTMGDISARHLKKAFYIVENAISLDRFPKAQRLSSNGSLKMLFVGRLVPYKGADMALDSAADILKSGKAQLTIVGDGPERESLEQRAAALGVSNAVQFLGNVAHEEIHRHFSQSDVLVFPSIREFGGAVVLEAMAMGCVPLIVNYGGPSELVTHATGFILDIGSRQDIVRQLRRTLVALCEDRSSLPLMAERGKSRTMSEFTWEAKARKVYAIYEWVLGRGSKPDLVASSNSSEMTQTSS